MDSMVGYKNKTYLHFGRAAARLDDAANFLPSRLAALLWIGAAAWPASTGGGAWRIWRRDRLRHASPNSAQTESACAGALGVQLAGPAWYFGEYYDKPTIGDDTRPVEPADILRGGPDAVPGGFLALGLGLGLALWPGGLLRCYDKENGSDPDPRRDWAGFAAEYGAQAPLHSEIARANVSPLGLPAGVAAALAGCASGCDRYPDPLCRELTAAIARAEGVPAEWVLCGNGAADLIWRGGAGPAAGPGAGHRPRLCRVRGRPGRRGLPGGAVCPPEAEGFRLGRGLSGSHPAGGRDGLSLRAQQPHRPDQPPAPAAAGAGALPAGGGAVGGG